MTHQVCHAEGRSASPSFLSLIPYRASGGDGQPVPVLPDICPKAVTGGQACAIQLHSWRERKTGPCYPLAVIKCKAHGGFFTLYPPGFGRYLRKPIWRVAPDGGPILREPTDAAGSQLQDARGTLFDAALDAADRKAWPREHEGGSDRWWQTQRRDLDKAMRLVGVGANLDERTVERLAGALGVPMMDICEARASLAASPGYQARGAAVTRILRATCGMGCVAKRLAQAGHIVGFWGKPYWFDRRPLRVRFGAFPPAGTPGARLQERLPEPINELET